MNTAGQMWRRCVESRYPVIVGMAGNVGVQATTVALRSLATGPLVTTAIDGLGVLNYFMITSLVMELT